MAGAEIRHRCEVRQLLRWRVEKGIEFARDYLAGVEKRRGQAAAKVLRDDVLAQWNAGNRGTVGDWREVAA